MRRWGQAHEPSRVPPQDDGEVADGEVADGEVADVEVADSEPIAPPRPPAPLGRGAWAVPLAFLIAAVVVGVSWWARADPPTWVAVQGRGYLDEVQRTRLFGVVALYAALSAVVALVLGGACAWVLRWTGWRHVALIALSSAVAAVVAWQVGLLLGPPDPAGSFGDRADGTRVAGAVTLDAFGVLLVWPFAAMLAVVLVGVVLVPDDPREPPEPAHASEADVSPGTDRRDPRNL